MGYPQSSSYLGQGFSHGNVCHSASLGYLHDLLVGGIPTPLKKYENQPDKEKKPWLMDPPRNLIGLFGSVSKPCTPW